MDYDDFFETLDELLTTINGTVEDEAASDSTSDSKGATVPFFSYMFDQDTDVFEGLDEDIKAFRLSPLH